MKINLKKLIAAGVAGATLAPALYAANINIVTVGGNSSSKLIQDRLPTILSGAVLTVNPTNSLIFRYTGTNSGNRVQWDFNLIGGAVAIVDVINQNPVKLVDNTTAVPVLAVSATAPETVGIDPTPLQQDLTVVVPVVYVKNPGPNNDLAGITNLTQRNAAYLESSSGTLPTAYFGGSPGSNAIPANALYFVGRNNLSAARQLFDANIYFTGTAGNYTTNASGQPIPYVDGLGNPSGAGSGTEVINILKAIPNSIGTVAAQDVGTLPTLSFEGVPYSVTNVINGSYPLWGYDRFIYYSSGALAPTAQQLSVIKALENAILDPTYEHTSSLFVNKFVSIADLQVQRSIHVDGGPITSAIY